MLTVSRQQQHHHRPAGLPPPALQFSGQLLDLTAWAFGEHTDRAHTDHDLAGWVDDAVEARAPRAVILHGVRAVVLDRQPPRRACFIKGIAGVLKVRRFDVDLDAENPQLRMQGVHDLPLTVKPDDPEEFWVQAITATNEITWTIALDWTVNGITGTTLVNHDVRLYPIDVLLNGPGRQSLRTACDHRGHEEGCPALTLTQLGGSTSTFWSAGDLDNGCLYTGIPALREMIWDGWPEQDPDHDENDAEDGS